LDTFGLILSMQIRASGAACYMHHYNINSIRLVPHCILGWDKNEMSALAVVTFFGKVGKCLVQQLWCTDGLNSVSNSRWICKHKHITTFCLN